MKKLFTVLIFLMLLTFCLKSQVPISSYSVDVETWTYWNQKDWKRLINTGKQALKNEIDFYYLRVRMGIAYYERQNFHMAIHHFEKALEFNSQESYLKKYLYYSYLNVGREHDAKVVATTFSIALAKELGLLTNNFIDQVSLMYGVNSLTNNSVLNNFSTSFPTPSNGSQEITKRLNILSIGLTHKTNPKFSLHHSYTNIQKESFKFSFEDGVKKTGQNYSTSINQYYISGSSWIGKGSTLLYGSHIINIRTPIEVTFFRMGTQYSYIEKVSNNDIVGFISFHKNLKYITLGLTTYGANLNSAKQLQGDISVTIYPLGNLNLYSTSTMSIQSESYSNKKHVNELVFNQLLGFKVFRHLWLEGFMAKGNMKNYLADYGATVFNGTEVIKERMGARGIIFFSPKVNIQITYSNTYAESSFIQTNDVSTTYNPVKHKNQTIIGGLIWNF